MIWHPPYWLTRSMTPPHLAVTINGSDVFPALCATDGSKQFIDNQSINGGRLIWEKG